MEEFLRSGGELPNKIHLRFRAVVCYLGYRYGNLVQWDGESDRD